MKRFSVWLEDKKSEEIRDAIVSRVRSDLGAGDDDEVLQFRTSQLSPEVQEELLKLGSVRDQVEPDKLDQLKELMQQSDTTIATLIDQIVGGIPAQPEQETQPPQAAPEMTPPQAQNFPTGTGWS